MINLPWYKLEDEQKIDTPALIIHSDRAASNIDTLVNSIDRIDRLRPHIKTHKSPEITRLFLDKGISKFKCATIAEAEMLANAGAKDVLLAYQPVGPKANRFLQLLLKFPETKFSCLIDNRDCAERLSNLCKANNLVATVYIDLNIGMNRTGIIPQLAEQLWHECQALEGIKVAGLHAYDGHLRDADFNSRKEKCDLSFQPVEALARILEHHGQEKTIIVAGGTPTFSVHCKRPDVECSPGTFIYWDKGYEFLLQEQHYLHAAVVMTRIISKPESNVLCVDLGHKSIASENPLHQRVFFLDADDLEPIGHSEEHMVLKTKHASRYKVGDVLYGIPYHVCPTVALYEKAHIVRDHKLVDTWLTTSRNRTITI